MEIKYAIPDGAEDFTVYCATDSGSRKQFLTDNSGKPVSSKDLTWKLSEHSAKNEPGRTLACLCNGGKHISLTVRSKKHSPKKTGKKTAELSVGAIQEWMQHSPYLPND